MAGQFGSISRSTKSGAIADDLQPARDLLSASSVPRPEVGRVLEPPAILGAVQQIDRYQVLREIARGGFGVV